MVRGCIWPPQWVISLEVEPFQETRGLRCVFVFPDVVVHLCMFHVSVRRENVTGQKEGSVTFG